MVPVKMKAIVTAGEKKWELRKVDVPRPGPKEILVKVVAAAQNPADWKNGWFWPTEGNIAGCDFAGIVEELGEEAPEDLSIGDRVACWVHGSHWENGAFAEYVVCIGALALHIPDSWTFEEAAQLPVACYTACLCLYFVNSFPTPLAPTQELTTDLLVWAGSTSIGQYIIQIARQSGLRVLTTCSPRNFALVKSLGATEAFDHNDPETPSKIRELTGNKLVHVVDCISEKGTSEKVAPCIGDAGGEVVIVLPINSPRKDVVCKFVLGYEIFGKAIEMPVKMPADPKKEEFGRWSAKLLNEMLAAENLKPGPIKIMPYGLAGVMDGFEYMQNGKVSGEKIVYRIAETPPE